MNGSMTQSAAIVNFELALDEGEFLLRQVAKQIESCIAKGIFPPGSKLPGERSLARQLKRSRNTIGAAYQMLEDKGLIRRLPQRGAFVCHASLTTSSISWGEKISRGAHLLDEPVLELLAHSRLPTLRYPLSAGSPCLSCFPIVEFRAAMNRVLDEEPLVALGIAPTHGQAKLRQAIAQLDGIEPNRVLVLSGAQEGIDLVARCLIEPGDYAVVERPTFPGIIQSLRAAGARLLQWEAGLWSAEQLERLIIGYSPKLIFTMPTFHNPTGQTMSPDQREALLDMAARYGVPIVEDDVYSRTSLSGPAPTCLRDMDRRNGVIYLSTFSKVFAPGLRLGWLVASPHMVKQLSLIKMRANLFTEGLQQLALASMIRDGSFESHVHTLRKSHAALRSSAIRALEKHFTYGELEWFVPHGGLYVWCRAKKPADVESALLRAEELGVAAAPGRAFFADDPDDHCFRLCFTSMNAIDFHEAVAILAKSWHLGQL